MPYYCTVPRCTSMAGKAKNVSFHQFPRDEELAKLWNEVLKRGKPYTKYSKVCSLHFRPEDYTITSVGKNKGQWRTLRKHAVPSQNLPLESPPVHYPRRTSTGMQGPSIPPNLMDPQIQQQVAQAIYVQTMLAMQAANYRECNSASEIQPNLLAGQNGSKVSPNFSNSDLQSSDKSNSSQSSSPRASGREISELELFLLKYNMPKNFPFPQLAGKTPENLPVDNRTAETEKNPAALPIDDRITESAMFLGKIPAEGKFPETSCLPERLYKDRFSRRNTEYGSVHSPSMTHAETYQCQECSKCFKDPDVFVLHKRTHIKTDPDIQIPHSSVSEKENVRINFDSPLDLDKNLRQQTLKSNPILANLLKSSERPKVPNPPSSVANNVLSLESQIMTAMAINMEAYVRSLMASKMVADADDTSDSDSVNQCDNQDLNESKDSNRLVIDETV